MRDLFESLLAAMLPGIFLCLILYAWIEHSAARRVRLIRECVESLVSIGWERDRAQRFVSKLFERLDRRAAKEPTDAD